MLLCPLVSLSLDGHFSTVPPPPLGLQNNMKPESRFSGAEPTGCVLLRAPFPCCPNLEDQTQICTHAAVAFQVEPFQEPS